MFFGLMNQTLGKQFLSGRDFQECLVTIEKFKKMGVNPMVFKMAEYLGEASGNMSTFFDENFKGYKEIIENGKEY